MWRNNSFRQHPFDAGIIATIVRMTPNYHRSILLAFWSHLNLKPSKSNQISIKPHSSNLSIANFLVLWSSKSSVGCANMGNATTQLWSYWWGITSKIRISPGDHGALVSLLVQLRTMTGWRLACWSEQVFESRTIGLQKWLWMALTGNLHWVQQLSPLEIISVNFHIIACMYWTPHNSRTLRILQE